MKPRMHLPSQGHGAKHMPGQQAGNQQIHKPGVLQPKMAMTSQIKKPQVAPPVYRPQPIPRVLQTKRANGNPNPAQARIISARHDASHVVHTPRPPAVSPPHMNTVQAKPIHNHIHQTIVTLPRPAIQRAALQRLKSAVVQATKYYPNLHPGAAVPVDRSNIFSLDSFANQYRLHRAGTHSVNVPNMKYNFVRTREGQTLLHNRYRHPSLAEGQQVLYAGEVFFNNGKLEWWSNGSGHYQPDADGAEQANLPMDYFYSYQQIIKGAHTRKNGAANLKESG
jgi:hypothetical protein